MDPRTPPDEGPGGSPMKLCSSDNDENSHNGLVQGSPSAPSQTMPPVEGISLRPRKSKSITADLNANSACLGEEYADLDEKFERDFVATENDLAKSDSAFAEIPSRKTRRNYKRVKLTLKSPKIQSKADEEIEVDDNVPEVDNSTKQAREVATSKEFKSNLGPGGMNGRLFLTEDPNTASSQPDPALESLDDEPPTTHPRPKGHEEVYTIKPISWDKGVDLNSPPMSKISTIFGCITELAFQHGFREVLSQFGNKPLRLATMCSGTEAPILGLNMIKKYLQKSGQESNLLQVQHVFSAEIVPWKQHYIEANFSPAIIFRDIVHMLSEQDVDGNFIATTAHGGKAVVPGDVDFLVAGFCCVDFSALNNKPQTLEDMGESGATLEAIAAYATEFKPKIILLENVRGAPWVDSPSTTGKRTVASHFDHLYVAIFHQLDTKEFSLPHTRQRGYMILVLKSLYKDDKDLDAATKNYESLVVAMKTAATSPVEDFLLKPDDPRLRARSKQSMVKVGKHVAWDKCQIGHEVMRSDIELGNKRPITHWSRDAPPRNPDFHIPLPEQSDRVSDTRDINFLRNVLRDFDDRYLSRNVDFSQNVYRIHDVNRPGFIGCLTPNGIPFNSTRGGIVLGLESLICQGIPVGDLELDQLSDAQLRDLAGNAMSSTVVTNCILAALISFGEVLDMGDRDVVVEEQVDASMNGETDLVEFVSKLGPSHPKTVQELLELARLSARLCYCEGRDDKLNTGLLRCIHCLHSACIKCAYSPKHKYKPLDPGFLNSRLDPVEAEVIFKKSVPMKLSFSNKFDVDNWIENFSFPFEDEDTQNDARELFKTALLSDIHYHGYRRREVIEMEFYSESAKVILRISEFDILWQFFVKVPEGPKGYAGNHAARLFFESYPIAQMTPTGDVVTEGQWHLWTHKPREFNATITSSGSAVESFCSKIGIEFESGKKAFSNINVAFPYGDDGHLYFPYDIRGDYVYRPDCGQAFDSLHIQKNHELSEGPPLGLFFHHDRQRGDPKGHQYTISPTTRRLDYGERRDICGNFRSWKPHTFRGESEVEQKTEDIFTVDGYWTKVGGFAIELPADEETSFRELPCLVSSAEELSCDTQLAAFSCQLSLGNNGMDLREAQWVALSSADLGDFFQAFGWRLERGKFNKGHTSQTLSSLDGWHALSDVKSACQKCAPEHPVMSWTFKSKGKQKARQVPFEEPEEATAFEKALKARPAGITIFYRIEEGSICIKVGINPTTLAHQALAAFKPSLSVETSWCFVTDNTPVMARLEPLKMKDAQDEDEISQPPGLAVDCALRPEQLKKLAWMIKQDIGVEFTEREFFESSLSEMGYLLLGQAKQRHLVRGGILADKVGFGKTILILALVLSRLDADEQFAAQTHVSGLIPSRATVVFVPAQLPKQWKTEAFKFISDSHRGPILIIETIAQLARLTINDIETAMLIIISCKVCQSPGYQLAVARLTGMVEPASSASARALGTWYGIARERIRSTVDRLRDCSADVQQFLRDEYDRNKKASQAKAIPIPSKRYTGEQFQQQRNEESRKRKAGEATVKNEKVETVQPRDKDEHKLSNLGKSGYKAMKFPVLEMFAFARVVIDEFTYMEVLRYVTMYNLEANARWALSGTPPHESFSGVKTMADVLHVHLGMADYSHMRRDAYEKAVMDMTASEKLLTYKGVMSAKMQELRHQQADQFLSTFTRQDSAIMPYAIKCTSEIRLVPMPLYEAGRYWELEREAASNDAFEVELRDKMSSSDKVLHIKEARGDSKSGREALMFRASASSILDKRILDENSESKKPPPTDAFQALMCNLEIRDRQADRVRQAVGKVMDQALYLVDHSESYLAKYPKHKRVFDAFKTRFDLFKRKMKAGGAGFGDPDANKMLSTVADGLFYKNHTTGEWDPAIFQGPWTEEKTPAFMARSLRDSADEFATRTRSIRFFQSILELHLREGICHKCCAKQNDSPAPGSWILAIGCGHTFCSESCADSVTGNCSVNGCATPLEYRNFIKGSAITRQNPPFYEFGNKLREITDLIKSIEGDQVLLFVQFDILREKLVEALKYSEISFVDMKSAGSRSNKLQNFQNTVGENQAKCLILNIGDESAAGSNLTMANHIIFVAPYLTLGSEAQKTYDDARTQAIGRACRYGQKKDVKIYDFVTEGTIDVDILEKRSGKILKKVKNDGEWEYKLVDRAYGEETEYGSRLADRIFPEGDD